MDPYERAARYLEERKKPIDSIQTFSGCKRHFSENDARDYMEWFRSKYSPKQLSKLDEREILDTVFDYSNSNSMIYELKREDESLSSYLGHMGGSRRPEHFPFRRTGENTYAIGKGMPFDSGETDAETAVKYAARFLTGLVDAAEFPERHPMETLDDYIEFEQNAIKHLGNEATYGWAHKYFCMLYPELFTQFHIGDGYRKNFVKVLGLDDIKNSVYASDWQLQRVRNHMENVSPYHFANIIYSIRKIFSAQGKSPSEIHSVFEHGDSFSGEFGNWQKKGETLLLNYTDESHDERFVPIPESVFQDFAEQNLSRNRIINVEYCGTNYKCELKEEEGSEYLVFGEDLYAKFDELSKESNLVFSFKRMRKNVYSMVKINEGLKPVSIPDSEEEQIEQAGSLSLKQLEIVARNRSNNYPSKETSVTVTQRKRDPYISEFAKARANGICQLCGKPAPFESPNGRPYLESHHIIWLSEGGPDSVDNTVALCPNCHRKMHIVNEKEDILFLQEKAKK